VEFHEVASIFPLMSADEYDALKLDIARNGQREPVWTWQDKIIDGRNRWRACEELGIIPQRREWDGNGSLVAFVVSLNLHRRHLTSSQRATVAVDMLPMLEAEARERQAHGQTAPGKTLTEKFQQASSGMAAAQAAEIVGTNAHYVADAKKLKAESPEVYEQVRSGELPLNRAVAGLRRAERIETIAAGNRPLNGNGQRYSVIYADPPWRYENPPMGATNRAIENHYPTMDLAEICALPVASLVADDAILYLWATAPKLAECMRVIESWGFEYRTNFVWVKDKIGMGYHARNQHELLLVARRGAIPPPAVETRVSSVVCAPRTEHSAKPVEFYELIESFYPELAKIELFCRSPREGWSVWGNQA
jgi:N6-adenosine-specific RNA methylase IME4